MDIAPNIHSRIGQKMCMYTLYWNIVYWRDFLPIPTGSAACIWRNILVFHFAVLSIYNLFIYGVYSLPPDAETLKDSTYLSGTDGDLNSVFLGILILLKKICRKIWTFLLSRTGNPLHGPTKIDCNPNFWKNCTFFRQFWCQF